MSDRDPRPMPAEVLRAYRDPVDLRGLLLSLAYSDKDRRVVLRSLMRSLIARHGDVWISVGGEEVSVNARINGRKMTQDVSSAIDLLCSIDEYGRSEGVLPMLAQAMQPRWSEWWVGFKWRGEEDVFRWRDVAEHVLGTRQFVWLASQFARVVIDSTLPHERASCRAAIEAAEAWALVPSEENRRAAARAADGMNSVEFDDDDEELWSDADEDESIAAFCAWRAADAAVSKEAGYQRWAMVANVAQAASLGASSIRFGKGSGYARFAELTRRLITPTLVTSASGAVRLAKRW